MRALTLAVCLGAPFLAGTLVFLHHPIGAVLVFAGGGIVAMTALLRPNVQWLGPVMTHFTTAGAEIWLTIDDGPTEDTASLLDLLDELQVRATFFVKGELARSYGTDAIVGRGHDIANHSDTHPSGTFWCLGPRAVARQVDRCASSIPATPLFRSPVGMKNIWLHPILEKRGMHLVGFSARAFDAVVRDPERIARSICRRLDRGGIVVLHQGRPWSLPAIRKTVVAALEGGYSFVIPSPDRLKTNR